MLYKLLRFIPGLFAIAMMNLEGAYAQQSDALGSLSDTLNDSIGGVTDTIDNTIGDINDINGEINGEINGVTDTVDQTIGGVTDTIDQTVGDVTSTIDETISGVTDTIDNTIGDVTGGIGGATGTIDESLGGITDVVGGGSGLGGIIGGGGGSSVDVTLSPSKQADGSIQSGDRFNVNPFGLAESLTGEVNRISARSVAAAIIGEQGQLETQEEAEATQATLDAIVRQAQEGQSLDVTQDVMKNLASLEAQAAALDAAEVYHDQRLEQQLAANNVVSADISEALDEKNRSDRAQEFGAAAMLMRASAQTYIPGEN